MPRARGARRATRPVSTRRRCARCRRGSRALFNKFRRCTRPSSTRVSPCTSWPIRASRSSGKRGTSRYTSCAWWPCAALGVGAHVAVLRRTAAGPFRAQQMIDMERLQALAEQGMEALDEVLLPMETALAQWPDICLSDEMAYYVRQGQPVFVPRAPTSGWVKLRTSDRRFLGMGQVMDDGRVAPKRLVSEGR